MQRLISCAEAVEQLWEYLDRDLDAHDHVAVEAHLAFCRQCCGELEFAKHLRCLLAPCSRDELTGPVRERLDRFIHGLTDGSIERDDVSEDLMFQAEIRATVRAAYRAIPSGAGRAFAERFYSDAELASLPEGAVAWALGVGNPVHHAELTAGDVVLDLGSGAGIDTVLAAHQVGPAGHIIGLDMLEEMGARARAAVQEAGVGGWCELRLGEMEDIPLPDASIDVVISNGVINLSPRKSRVFAEIARVLRPGGQVCVSDLVVDDDLPPEVLSSGAAWAGCIAGALSEQVFAHMLDRAGLVDIELSERRPFSLDDVALYPLFTPEVLDLMRRVLPPDAQRHVATSLVARARRPVT